MTFTITQTSNVSDLIVGTNSLIVQRYCPPRNQVNKDFLRQIFMDQKKLKLKKEVDYIHVAHFEELSVKNMWNDLKDDETFSIYFQDKFPKDRLPNREYFFNILNTVYPDYLKQVMEYAAKERYSVDGAT